MKWQSRVYELRFTQNLEYSEIKLMIQKEYNLVKTCKQLTNVVHEIKKRNSKIKSVKSDTTKPVVAKQKDIKVTISQIQKERSNPNLDNKILQILKKDKFTVIELSKLLTIPEKDVQTSIENLVNGCYSVTKDSNNHYMLDRNVMERYINTLVPYYENSFRFGVVSDTHSGSTHEQLTNLHLAYDIFEANGIQIVLHPGDTHTGINMYRGQQYEVHKQGADQQRDWSVKTYPRRKSITTYMIAGNHDASFMSASGYDIVESVCKERHDIKYTGFMAGNISLENGLQIELLHPDGGVPYAQSYRSQKINEARGRGEDVPHIALYGHMHIALFNPYLGVYDVCCGCFEGQTTYEKRKGLNPEIGCWIIEVNMKEKNGKKVINRIYQEWIQFDEIKNDWKNY